MVAMTERTHRAWLDRHREEAIDPALPIVDAHHHLWTGYGRPVPWQPDYWIDEFHLDLSSGHNIVATVFVECGYSYRVGADSALAPVGEVEAMDRFASQYEERHGAAHRPCAAIVGHADLRLGGAVERTLEALIAASPRRFRGIRQITNWDPHENVRYPGFFIEPGVMADRRFREGFAQLGRYGLSFDAWQFHPQMLELVDLAKAFPYTTVVVDHLGGPVGIGSYADRRAEVRAAWDTAAVALAELPNTVMKLGGLNMEHAGHHWHEHERPPSSDDLVAANGDYILRAIDLFGPERCMFESNTPVDKVSCSYVTLWNAFKKLGNRFTAAERTALFSGTARRVYRIGV